MTKLTVALNSWLITSLILTAPSGAESSSGVSTEEAKAVLKTVLSSSENFELIAADDLKDLNVKPAPFLSGDFNSDGQTDLALSGVSPWKMTGVARTRDAFFVIATKNSNGKWSKVFSFRAESVSCPFIIWDDKKRVLIPAAGYSDTQLGLIRWNSTKKSYEHTPSDSDSD